MRGRTGEVEGGSGLLPFVYLRAAGLALTILYLVYICEERRSCQAIKYKIAAREVHDALS